jgi:hypothetical protein
MLSKTSNEFRSKKHAAGAFFAVEAQELHPSSSVVPNFFPDVEHRFYPERPTVTIKEDGTSCKISKLFPSNLSNLQEYHQAHYTGDNLNTIARGCKEHLRN